jgi:PAS domain S-box-containing protein
MPDHPNNRFVERALLNQSSASVRLVVALFTLTAAITKLLYDHFLPSLQDINAIRWGIIGLGCVLFATTYVRSKRARIVPYFSALLYFCTLLYVLAYVVINKFDPNAVTILILVVGASSVIINNLGYYAVQCGIIILTCLFTYSGIALGTESLIAFLNLFLALAVFGIVIAVRLKLISSVKNSHSYLERLNVLSIIANKSGDIVFVSPSVKNLLGYEPYELARDGWWRINGLREGWISKDYILNYPNILPKEIMSMETSMISRDGKQMWFSWVNSMLPNGNYVGVALDITKYKTAQKLTA